MSTLRTWFPLAVVITLLVGLIYVSVQQVYRQSANDPQIQMAEDAAVALTTGASVASLAPATKVDIGTSLAPYLIVYSESGQPEAGSGELDGQLPKPPSGVFDYARLHSDDRLTWQPQIGVRSAIVIKHFGRTGGGFVLAGRSLRETELREDALFRKLILGWLISLLLTLVACALESVPPKKSH